MTSLFSLKGPRPAAAQASARLGFAVFDQAVFAGAPFVFTVLLARWLTQTDFGAFSVAFAAFVLFQNVFEGLIYEPLGVFGSGRLLPLLDAYTGRLLIGLSILGLIFTALIASFALILQMMGQSALANAFAGAAVAVTLLLARILIRQPLYIASRIQWSIVGGMTYFLCTLAGLCTLQHLGFLDSFSAFLAMAVGSGLSSALIILIVLKPVWHTPDPALTPRRLMSEHMAYGKWAVGERLLLWFQGSIFYFELPLVADLHSGAAFRAVSTLALPASMTMIALGSVLLPILARIDHTQTKPHWIRLLLPGTVCVVLCYAIALISFGGELGHLLFSGQYDSDLTAGTLAVVSIGLVLSAINGVLELKLRATRRVRQVLMARLASTLVLLCVGIGITASFQLLGAFISLALVWLTTVCVHIAMNLRAG